MQHPCQEGCTSNMFSMHAGLHYTITGGFKYQTGHKP